MHKCWTLEFYLAIYIGLLPCRYIKFHCLWNVRQIIIYCLCRGNMHKIMKFILYLFLSGAKWSHQTYHRQWHSVFSFRNCWNKCQVCEHFECLFNICQINDITTLSFCLWFYTNIMFIWLPFCYSTTYITCPADPKKTLGIKLPFLVMIIKNLKKYFTFEVQVCFWIISMLMNMRCIDKSLSALIVSLCSS